MDRSCCVMEPQKETADSGEVSYTTPASSLVSLTSSDHSESLLVGVFVKIVAASAFEVAKAPANPPITMKSINRLSVNILDNEVFALGFEAGSLVAIVGALDVGAMREWAGSVVWRELPALERFPVWTSVVH